MCIRDRYSEDFIKFPVENRKKSALKLFFMTELKPIREFARANKISVSTVNVFLCHAAVSYTHLDVYKRQWMKGVSWRKNSIAISTNLLKC